MKAQQATTTTAQHLAALPPLLLLFLLSTLVSKVHALEIRSASEFIDFANKVNSGTNNYEGETVYLTNDLDFADYSSSFVPVGKSNDANTFRGTFDGQGHIISNLNVSSDEFPFLGVFGYSTGTTIKNLVVDESCSFESNYSTDNYNSIIGGILGQCYPTDGECVVENCVNMASIKYTGTTSLASYLGGIVGKITPVNYDTSIANCVNYGSISSASPSLNQIRIGGIASEAWTSGAITSSNTIKNCVNFGTLSQSGEVIWNLYMGGISAVDSPNVVYENCLSLGTISWNEKLPIIVGAGSISGFSTAGNFHKLLLG